MGNFELRVHILVVVDLQKDRFCLKRVKPVIS